MVAKCPHYRFRKKINRDAWLIEISNSSHDEKFHVWIEKEMFMLLGAEKKTLHDKGFRLSV